MQQVYSEVGLSARSVHCGAAGLTTWRLWYLGVVWVRACVGALAFHVLCRAQRTMRALDEPVY